MKYVIFTGAQNQRVFIYIDKVVALSELDQNTVIFTDSEKITVKHPFDDVINMIKKA